MSPSAILVNICIFRRDTECDAAFEGVDPSFKCCKNRLCIVTMFALLLILSPTAQAQTAIVAFRTPTMIVIGADGVTYTRATSKIERSCKIQRTDNVFF